MGRTATPFRNAYNAAVNVSGLLKLQDEVVSLIFETCRNGFKATEKAVMTGSDRWDGVARDE
jgi:hypothetical protein